MVHVRGTGNLKETVVKSLSVRKEIEDASTS